ncbi:discoidin domain-containing protein [Arthrobacter sp. P2b]|uniref:discoidin domain-containing protein n=1 Tax=Arthrobacter sp. P2b TaxID=1938741 RepID=UPI0009D60D60|nr:discoidin domain-containing protein [Arthrobacter sp. P2b]SLJ91330.1 O-Glycosyl hydrolase [Arthrobacter sp. P2b]
MLQKLRVGLAGAVALALTMSPAQASDAPPTSQVSVTLTDLSTGTYLDRGPKIRWQEGKAPDGDTITIDANRAYQTMDGFGASFTDSSAWLIGTKLDHERRNSVMRDLFDSQQGIGLSFIRQPMGASDFSAAGNWSYDDMPPGETDPGLENFSIDHDQAYTLPLLRQALKINPDISLMATPFSPPGWMKTSDSMIGGTLKPEFREDFANYFVKFIKAYEANGVPIDFISLQNEPTYQPPTSPSSLVTVEQANDLIKNYVGPALRANDLSTKILTYDFNYDLPSYAETPFADPESSKFVNGTAWHCYAGDVRMQTVVHNDYPNKTTHMTECSGGTWEGTDQDAFNATMNHVIGSTRNWAKSVVRWNMALDADRGPTNGGCDICRGVLTVAEGADGEWDYTKNVDYYALGQASKFVEPGAQRVASSTLGAGSVQDVAFVNPDGSSVLVTHNSGQAAQTFKVQSGDHWFEYTLNPGAAATFTWKGDQRGSTDSQAVGSVDLVFDQKDGTNPVVTYSPDLSIFEDQVRVGDRWFGQTVPTGGSIELTRGQQPLPRAGWTATAIATEPGGSPENALDEDPTTRWATGRGMQQGDWFDIDMGSTQTVDQITIDSGTSLGDQAHGYQIFVSQDGTNWGEPIVTGAGKSQQSTAIFPETQARYIRVMNVGAAQNWWSIYDVKVFAPTGPVAERAGEGDLTQVQRRTATLADGTEVTALYNAGTAPVTFQGDWGPTPYIYRLPAGGVGIFTERPAS